jgi:hypothetical protein
VPEDAHIAQDQSPRPPTRVLWLDGSETVVDRKVLMTLSIGERAALGYAAALIV